MQGKGRGKKTTILHVNGHAYRLLVHANGDVYRLFAPPGADPANAGLGVLG